MTSDNKKEEQVKQVDEKGAEALAGALDRDHDGSILENLGDLSGKEVENVPEALSGALERDHDGSILENLGGLLGKEASKDKQK